MSKSDAEVLKWIGKVALDSTKPETPDLGHCIHCGGVRPCTLHDNANFIKSHGAIVTKPATFTPPSKRFLELMEAYNQANRPRGSMAAFDDAESNLWDYVGKLEAADKALLEALENLMAFIKTQGWDKSFSGRQILLKDAEAALNLARKGAPDGH